jgi:membrane dipeptidase
LAVVLRHVEHLLKILGPDGVAIGSDLDGALLPAKIGDARGLGNLVTAMADRGYGPDLLQKLCHENWLDVLERSWSTT